MLMMDILNKQEPHTHKQYSSFQTISLIKSYNIYLFQISKNVFTISFQITKYGPKEKI